MPPFTRGEKITDPAVLDRLAKAREKALEVRRANKQRKDDERLLRQMEKKQQAQEVQDKLEALTKSKTPSPPQNNPQPKPVPEPEEEESEPEEQIVVKKKKPKKKPKKVVVYQTDSEESEEDELALQYQTPTPSAGVDTMVPELSYADRMYEATYGRLKRF